MESNGTGLNQKLKISQISNNMNLPLYIKKNYILIIKNGSNSSETNKSLIEENGENSTEKIFEKILSTKDISYNYIIETIRDDPDTLISFLKDVLSYTNIELIVFENFKEDKHKSLIRTIKDKDKNVKIIILVGNEKLDPLKTYCETMNIEAVLDNQINETKYEELFWKLRII